MRKYFLRNNYLFNSITVILALFSFSCEEDFSPIGELKDKYILTCILRGDTTLQTAFLSRSYLNDSAADSVSNDPNLKTADIRIWHKDSVYSLKGTHLFKETASKDGHHTEEQYFTDHFTPVPGETVEIVAELNNGRMLKATTKVPQDIEVDLARSDTLIPMPGKNYIEILWTEKDKNVFYIPRFTIIYTKTVNGNEYVYNKHIPLYYETVGAMETPIFASPSRQSGASVDLKDIDRAMREISGGDMDREKYKINIMKLEVIILDVNLAAFYAASRTQEDGFTVKIDQSDYSNIDGGLGIFSSYTKKSFFIFMSEKYIKSFGYLAGVKGH